MAMKIELTPIGVIHSPCKEPEQAPIQAARSREMEARIEVFPDYAKGLDDLLGFECIWVIYYCHRARPWSPKVVPYMDTEQRGVFATRSPSRPNALAISAVRLLRREGNALVIRGVDMIDQSPLLDLKPYIPSIDSRPECVRNGWIGKRRMDRKADDRFC